MSVYIIQGAVAVLVTVIASATTLWSERRRGKDEVRRSHAHRDAEARARQMELASEQLQHTHDSSMDIIDSLQEENSRLRALALECETTLDKLRDDLRTLKDDLTVQTRKLRESMADNQKLSDRVASLERAINGGVS